MKIAYFSDTYSPQVNGVTNTIGKLEEYLSSNNIEYLFIAPEYSKTAMQAKQKGVARFKSLPLPFYPECRLSIPVYPRLCRIMDSFKPDLIHLITPLGIGMAGLKYARNSGIPLVSSFHTNFDKYLKYYNLEYLYEPVWNYFKWFHGFCKANFCPSRDTMETLKSKNIDNLRIWARGIDTGCFSPGHRSSQLRQSLGCIEEKLFLYVGRLAVEKDIDILMQSIGSINCVYPGKVHFVIAGDGPYARSLMDMAPENVTFPGYLRGSELAAMYASCDVFVFPSTTETFGNVVLEAMASGLPVITVDSGGVKDSIIDGYNGIICRPRDADSFTRAIIKLLNAENQISSMAKNARKYALTKSWESVFNQLINDYYSVLENPADKNYLKHLA